MYEQFRKGIGVLFLSAAITGAALAQTSLDGIWNALDGDALEAYQNAKAAERPWVAPERYGVYTLDEKALGSTLGNAPLERLDLPPAARPAPELITLPMPDGTYALFEFVESPIMAPALAAKFPEIRTYLGQGIDDPTASVRFDWTPAGFHAQILGAGGALYIDPYYKDDSSNL